MSYLVTGGTGFIGSYLVRELVERGEKVYVMSRRPQIEKFSDIKDKVKIVAADVFDAIDILHTIKECDVKYIVHLAYLLISESQNNPRKAIEVNCLGTANVFEIGRIADVERIVWASSVAVYGPASYYGHLVNEDDPPKPASVYGACKVLNEFLGEHYYRVYGLDNIGLRFTFVYGPGRVTGGTAFISELIEKPAVGKPAKISYGDQKLNWQYVKDAVKAILLALEVRRARRRIFNTGGSVHTIREVADYVKQLLPNSIIEVEPGKMDGYLDVIADLDLSRAKEELGYTPTYTIKQGIYEYINTIRSRAGLPLIERNISNNC